MLIFLLGLSAGSVFGQSPVGTEDVMLSEHDQPEVWVQDHMRNAFKVYDEGNDFETFDKNTKDIIGAVENTYDSDLIFVAHLLYLRHSPENNYSDQLRRSIDRVENLIPKKQDEAIESDSL